MAQAIFNPATQQLDFVYSAALIAPSSAQYWVATADATLTAERNLGLLTTGLVKNTVTTGVGVPSTAVDGTDYLSPIYISDTAYGAGWDTDTTHAASKNAIYDKIQTILGTVTSVALSLPTELTVSGSPITAAGTLSAVWASATQHYVFAAPSGSSGTPSFRAIDATDIPTLNQNTSGSSASCTGNAATATALQTARAINGVNFDGTAPITITAVMSVTEVTGTTQSAVGNNAYIANNAGLVTITLPTTCTVGQRIKIVGQGAGLWKLAQNASQLIHFIGTDTTTGTGGSISAITRYDCLEIMCTVTNNEYVVCNSEGNFTVV